MSTQTGPRDGGATVLERVNLAQWRADESRWRGHRPVVIAGAFADTVAVDTWTPESMAERFPATKVKVIRENPDGSSATSPVMLDPMTMVHFVALLREGHTVQTMQSLWRTVGLYGEVDIPRAVAPPYFTVNLWMGHATRTRMHFDRTENVFVQVYGTKRFIVEPPSSPARRYMHEGTAENFSRVDPLAPDPLQFPTYDRDHQRIALVAPGDALYLPPRWFHDVTALGTSISVNCWHTR